MLQADIYLLLDFILIFIKYQPAFIFLTNINLFLNPFSLNKKYLSIVLRMVLVIHFNFLNCEKHFSSQLGAFFIEIK